MSASNFPGYHSSSYSSRTLKLPYTDTTCPGELIGWSSLGKHKLGSTRTTLEPLTQSEQRWCWKKNIKKQTNKRVGLSSPTQTAFLLAWQLQSGTFPKEPYENRQLLKAPNIIYDSRIQDLILLWLNHPLHSMQIITFWICWFKKKKNHIDLICLGLGMWGEDTR